MPKKKSVKKKKGNPLKVSSRGLDSKKKFRTVFRRFLFFLILFVIFLVLYYATSNELWNSFLGMGALIFGFISAALLIVLLILWFLKLMKKK